MEKKFDVKKFLSNNAIIILIALLALFVGSTTQNFFTVTNGKNLLLNVAPRFIIACGVSGCLITKGTDLSAGRQETGDRSPNEEPPQATACGGSFAGDCPRIPRISPEGDHRMECPRS